MIGGLLNFAIQVGASDVHIVQGVAPCFRIDGKIYRIFQLPGCKKLLKNYPDLGRTMTGDIIGAIVKKIAPENIKTSKFGYRIDKDKQFRVNVYHQKNSPAIAFRVLYPMPFTMKEIFKTYPESINAFNYFTRLPSGLVLITGPPGSGKSTTLASIVNEINENDAKHIITIESPIEYEHSHKKSIISQMEVGIDVEDFATGIRTISQPAVDVIAIDEMRDIKTIKQTILAANRGHLVFAILNANKIVDSIEWIVSIFKEQKMYRIAFAEAFQGIIFQQLIQKNNGGRIVNVEFITKTPKIRKLIIDADTDQIRMFFQSKNK